MHPIVHFNFQQGPWGTWASQVYLREGIDGNSLVGSKMASLPNWKTLCGLDRPKEFAIYSSTKGGGNGISKIGQQAVGVRF